MSETRAENACILAKLCRSARRRSFNDSVCNVGLGVLPRAVVFLLRDAFEPCTVMVSKLLGNQMVAKYAEDNAVVAGPQTTGHHCVTLASSNVLIEDPDVTAYLDAYRDLAELLPAACEYVRKRLGDTVELSLELYRDPEIEDRFLVIFVRQRSYDELTMERIRQASEALVEQLRDVDGCLVVTTDFRTPRKPHALPLERAG